MPSQQVQVRPLEQRRVRRDRKADRRLELTPSRDRVIDTLVNERAIEKRLAPDEADRDPPARRTCDQPVDRLERHVRLHHPGRPAESPLIGVAVRARKIAGLRHIQRKRDRLGEIGARRS